VQQKSGASGCGEWLAPCCAPGVSAIRAAAPGLARHRAHWTRCGTAGPAWAAASPPPAPLPREWAPATPLTAHKRPPSNPLVLWGLLRLGWACIRDCTRAGLG
jgi:hypothetical protein